MGAFNQAERDMLTRLADSFLPGNALDSSERVYDFVTFIESFLSAFDQAPPRIYAGGPFSNRNAPASASLSNDFKESLPLSRYQRLAWKLRIGGAQALATEPFVVISKDMKNLTGLDEIISS